MNNSSLKLPAQFCVWQAAQGQPLVVTELLHTAEASMEMSFPVHSLAAASDHISSTSGKASSTSSSSPDEGYAVDDDGKYDVVESIQNKVSSSNSSASSHALSAGGASELPLTCPGPSCYCRLGSSKSVRCTNSATGEELVRYCNAKQDVSQSKPTEKSVVQVNAEGAVVRMFASVSKASRALNLSTRSIREVCNGSHKSTRSGKVFVWGEATASEDSGRIFEVRKQTPGVRETRRQFDSKRQYGSLVIRDCFRGENRGSFRTEIMINGEEEFIGIYKTLDEAVAGHNREAVFHGMPLCSLDEVTMKENTFVRPNDGSSSGGGGGKGLLALSAAKPQVLKRKALPPPSAPASNPVIVLPPPEHLGVRKSRRASMPVKPSDYDTGGEAIGGKQTTMLERHQHFAMQKVEFFTPVVFDLVLFNIIFFFFFAF
jgi:hypothetical protein